jgi:acyl carrier protein
MNERAARRAATQALVAYIGEITATPTAEIDVRAPFMDIGLTSRQIVRLAVIVEDVIGTDVAATVGFDHGSIQRLADFVASELVEST